VLRALGAPHWVAVTALNEAIRHSEVTVNHTPADRLNAVLRLPAGGHNVTVVATLP
jgi:hypothetical protein